MLTEIVSFEERLPDFSQLPISKKQVDGCEVSVCDDSASVILISFRVTEIQSF